MLSNGYDSKAECPDLLTGVIGNRYFEFAGKDIRMLLLNKSQCLINSDHVARNSHAIWAIFTSNLHTALPNLQMWQYCISAQANGSHAARLA